MNHLNQQKIAAKTLKKQDSNTNIEFKNEKDFDSSLNRIKNRDVDNVKEFDDCIRDDVNEEVILNEPEPIHDKIPIIF